MADSYNMAHFTQINNELIFNIYGSGRGEYRKLISESSSPWSFSLGGLYTSFFIKPKPKIRDLPPLQRECTPLDIIIVNGRQINLHGCNAIELYVNVTNDGKTTIKRMRARAKIHPLRSLVDRSPIERPPGMSDEHWPIYRQRLEDMARQSQERINQYLFGRALPFSRTPNGTIAFQWIQTDDRTTYEVDLTPKSDEASVKLIGIYPLNRIARSEVTNAGLNTQNYPFQYHVVINIGNVQFLTTSDASSDRDTGILFEGLVKFRIFAENASDEVSEIFHIEIPMSLNTIVCTKVKKYSRDYRKFDKMFSV